MKSHAEITVLRHTASIRLAQLQGQLSPKQLGILQGIYAACCYIQDMPGQQYDHMQALIDGRPVVGSRSHETGPLALDKITRGEPQE